MTGNRMIRILPAILVFVLCIPAVSADDAARAIEQRLMDWTEAFNEGRIEEACDLFAPELIANYQGVPERSYQSQCDDLKAAFAKEYLEFRYRLELEEIILSGDLAVVRLIWHLTVTDKATGETEVSADRGLDVFKLQPDGKWRIIRYIGFLTDEPLQG